MTRRVLLRCDSTGDLYPVMAPSSIPYVFFVSQHTWHQRLGHPGREGLRHLVSNNFISCNKEKPHMLCHACQLGQASNHSGYRCLDLKTNKIIISRHVTFDETVFPYGSTQPALPPTNTFLDDILDIIPPVILTNLAVPLPPEPITLIHNTLIQHHPDAAHLPTPPQQLSLAQVQTIGNQAHLPPHPYRPLDTNIVHCMWLFGHKYMEYGTLSHYKACLVANGSTQLEGVDVDETFSLVVKPETLYMHQPPGFWDFVHPDYGTDTAYLLLYVDDIILTASSEILLQQIIRSLHQEFAMTDLGLLNYFLGIFVLCDSLGLFISQKKYVVEILDRAHMVNCNPIWTPIDTESKLGSDGDPVSDPTLYRSLAGSLQYLTFTRPNISYAVQQVCLYMHDPRESHFDSLKRILRYVRGTLGYGLQLFSSSTTNLVAYSDADWAGCPTTQSSTSGYYVFLGKNLLSWSSKCQLTLSRSSAEAEYHGVSNAVAGTCWLQNLLHELHTPLTFATLVYYDDVSVVYLSCNLVQHQRTKHIEIDIHFVHDLVDAGQVRVPHVPSRDQF
uniref:Ribonuclease H-like domain-containing protein n=1 Tax=Tanacetum cinerariifolium TaxID=118510 RepID=A0A6L2NS26_TANCI|nr:ribonuclease H-like domain-containing protein [Tanacetum cinerariifolium]